MSEKNIAKELINESNAEKLTRAKKFKSILKKIFFTKKGLLKLGVISIGIFAGFKAIEYFSPEFAAKLPLSHMLITGALQSKKSPEEIKKEYDWDKNGKIEGNEQKAYKLRLEHDALVKDGKAKAEFSEYDVNKDGKVDDVEKEMRKQSYELRKEKFAEDMKKMGINPNGELTEKEKAVVNTAKQVYGLK